MPSAAIIKFISQLIGSVFFTISWMLSLSIRLSVDLRMIFFFLLWMYLPLGRNKIFNNNHSFRHQTNCVCLGDRLHFISFVSWFSRCLRIFISQTKSQLLTHTHTHTKGAKVVFLLQPTEMTAASVLFADAMVKGWPKQIETTKGTHNSNHKNTKDLPTQLCNQTTTNNRHQRYTQRNGWTINNRRVEWTFAMKAEILLS